MSDEEKRARFEVRVTFDQYTALSRMCRERGFSSVGEMIESLIDNAMQEDSPIEPLSEFPSEEF